MLESVRPKCGRLAKSTSTSHLKRQYCSTFPLYIAQSSSTSKTENSKKLATRTILTFKGVAHNGGNDVAFTIDMFWALSTLQEAKGLSEGTRTCCRACHTGARRKSM
jgi:hypothetical protein